MNLPGVVVDLPTLTDKDIDDIKNWGVKSNVDFIAASFVRKADDVVKIREVLGEEVSFKLGAMEPRGGCERRETSHGFG